MYFVLLGRPAVFQYVSTAALASLRPSHSAVFVPCLFRSFRSSFLCSIGESESTLSKSKCQSESAVLSQLRLLLPATKPNQPMGRRPARMTSQVTSPVEFLAFLIDWRNCSFFTPRRWRVSLRHFEVHARVLSTVELHLSLNINHYTVADVSSL